MFSPLEQFYILPVLYLFNFISITNEVIILILVLACIIIVGISLTDKTKNSFFFVSTHWQKLFQLLYEGVLSIILTNINHTRGQKFFPLLFNIFVFILILNLIGLVPNSFTLTSHIIVTFGMSFSLFIGITTICILEHKFKFFCLFLPSGTPTLLAFLLIPIEFISYFFKPISLGIRLFANLMAGHTLMHVIAGFGYTFITQRAFVFFGQYIPVLIILPLFILDTAVCTIQAFVFCMLISIYLNDALSLH